MDSQDKKTKVEFYEEKLKQAKADLAKAKREEREKLRKDQNQHKYMMGGIVVKYFPECYEHSEEELLRIIAAGIKSQQCKDIIELVKKERTSGNPNLDVKKSFSVFGNKSYGGNSSNTE